MKTTRNEHKKLLGISLPTESQREVLEKIIKYTKNPEGNFVIMSLNPEILVETTKNPPFKEVVAKAQIKIVDGVGVALAARLRLIPVAPRLSGVDMMDALIARASTESLSVMLIGGRQNVADSLADCYHTQYPALNIVGFQGIKNIHSPTQAEIEKLFAIVADRKPHIIFFAFGSPMQELFVETHAKRLSGIVCAGVGGSFDFLAGIKPRAPRFIRTMGLEWAYRLVHEPWRWRRQLKLITFVRLVAQEALDNLRQSFTSA